MYTRKSNTTLLLVVDGISLSLVRILAISKSFFQFPALRTRISDASIDRQILGNPEVTANIYGKSRNLPNTDTQNSMVVGWE